MDTITVVIVIVVALYIGVLLGWQSTRSYRRGNTKFKSAVNRFMAVARSMLWLEIALSIGVVGAALAGLGELLLVLIAVWALILVYYYWFRPHADK